MPARNEETVRLEEARESKAPWKKWGLYLSERQGARRVLKGDK